jgi:hypothetical protein
MSNILKFSNISEKIIEIRGKKVILDYDVAEHYGVETREVNQAVKNNPDKFPKNYIINLKNNEFHDLRSKFSTANLEKTRVLPKSFTEKGLYILATILKSEKATKATIDIVEAFANLRELQTTVAEMSKMSDKHQQKSLMQKGGEIIADLIGSNLDTTEDELLSNSIFLLLSINIQQSEKKNRKNKNNYK